jgi:hypothetical protein
MALLSQFSSVAQFFPTFWRLQPFDCRATFDPPLLLGPFGFSPISGIGSAKKGERFVKRERKFISKNGQVISGKPIRVMWTAPALPRKR